MCRNVDMIKRSLKLCSFTGIIIATCMLAGGCSDTTEPERSVVIGENREALSLAEDETTNPTYVFVYNNVKITPNDLVDPIIAALGSEYSYHESPSCAYIGLDKCYVYSGFSIYTYPDDNAVDHVLQIVLTDDTLSTPEGLMLGDTEDRVKELYGDDYTESNGSYSYSDEKTTLLIIMKNGRVQSIQYSYTESF